ncbi:hypothetical protein BDV19DRAFT_356496 [Aspergillus venezuelensis]
MQLARDRFHPQLYQLVPARTGVLAAAKEPIPMADVDPNAIWLTLYWDHNCSSPIGKYYYLPIKNDTFIYNDTSAWHIMISRSFDLSRDLKGRMQFDIASLRDDEWSSLGVEEDGHDQNIPKKYCAVHRQSWNRSDNVKAGECDCGAVYLYALWENKGLS